MNNNDKAFKELQATVKQLQQFVTEDIPDIIGTEAIEYAKDNIDAEGFDGEKWQSRKDNKPHKLLNQTDGLRESFYDENSSQVVRINSDTKYAQVHNEGLKAGRGKGFTMPKRQFLGESDKLKERINKEITKQMKKLT